MKHHDEEEFSLFFQDIDSNKQSTPQRTSNSKYRVTPQSRNSSTEMMSQMAALTPRMEVLLRKEKKLLEEEANYTFQPKMVSTRDTANKSRHAAAGASSYGGNSRFDQLYSDALKRHLESQWKQHHEDRDLTFKPKINRSRPSSRGGSRAGSPPRSETSRASSTDRLYNQSIGNVKGKIVEDLTFKPSITKRAQSIDRKASADRLYGNISNYAEVEKRREEDRTQHLLLQETSECTFSPKTNSAKPKFKHVNDSLDLNERMNSFLERKEQRIQEAKQLMEAEESLETTFQPAFKSRPASTPLAPFHERLAQSITSRLVPDEVIQEAYAEMTFRPKLVSRRSVSPTGPRPGGESSVYDRLYQESKDRKKEEEQEKVLQAEKEVNLTFHPVICKKSLATVRKLRAEEGAVDEPFYERLATGTSKQYMQDVLLKVQAELELRECTFQPKLFTDNSRFRLKSTMDDLPVYERLNKEARDRVERLTSMKDSLISEEDLNNTHHPQIPSKSQDIVMKSAPHRSDGENGIFDRLNRTQTRSRSVSPSDTASQDSDRRSVTHPTSFYHSKYGRSGSISPAQKRFSAAELEAVANELYAKKTVSLTSPAVDAKAKFRFEETLRSSQDALQPVYDDPTDDGSVTPSVKRVSTGELDSIVGRLNTHYTKALSAPLIDVPPRVEIQTMLRSSSSLKSLLSSSTEFEPREVTVVRREASSPARSITSSSSQPSSPSSSATVHRQQHAIANRSISTIASVDTYDDVDLGVAKGKDRVANPVSSRSNIIPSDRVGKSASDAAVRPTTGRQQVSTSDARTHSADLIDTVQSEEMPVTAAGTTPPVVEATRTIDVVPASVSAAPKVSSVTESTTVGNQIKARNASSSKLTSNVQPSSSTPAAHVSKGSVSAKATTTGPKAIDSSGGGKTTAATSVNKPVKDRDPVPVIASTKREATHPTPAANPQPLPAAPAERKVLPPAVPAIRSSGGGGGDFLSKIEASMQMLQMTPSQIVAQQRQQQTNNDR